MPLPPKLAYPPPLLCSCWYLSNCDGVILIPLVYALAPDSFMERLSVRNLLASPENYLNILFSACKLIKCDLNSDT
jgi:hypothetical protein